MLEEQWKALVHTIRQRHPAFYALRFPHPTRIQDSALRDDEQVLAYEVTDQGVLVFLIRGKHVLDSVFKPITRQKLDDLVRRFRGSFEKLTPRNAFEKLRSFDISAGAQL